MKNNLKKCLALLVAMVMVLAMTTSVFADVEPSTYTITINKQNDGVGVPSANTYKAYLVSSFKVSNNVYVDYEIQDAFKRVVNNQVALEAYAEYNYDATELQSLANSLAACITDFTPVAATSDSQGTIMVDKTGYYLLVETEHGDDVAIETRYILVAVDGNEEVYLKTSAPTVEKKILLENSTKNVTTAATAGSKVDNDAVAIGDTVTYQLEATIPSYPVVVNNNGNSKVTFKLTDVMSDGLTYDSVSSVKVGNTDLELNKGYTVSSTAITGGTQIEIKIDPTVVLDNGGKTVVVQLTATLNNNANVGATGNPNSVDLTYTNHWDVEGTPDGTDTTDEDTVITYTGELYILKIDETDKDNENPTGLAGAGFEIKDGDTLLKFTAVKKEGTEEVDYYRYDVSGTVTEVVTGTDGTLKLVGLDNGTYIATEKTAPEGYNVDSTPQTLTLTVEAVSLETEANPITPSGANGTASNDNAESTYKATWKTNGGVAKITNKKGTTLPGTGGIGTTLFTFGGLALVILAAVLFIVYTKKQKKQS